MSTKQLEHTNGFTKDTYVLTEHGPVLISEIKKNTKLYTYEAGTGYVLKSVSDEIHPLEEKHMVSLIILNNGLSINCTNNQPFMKKMIGSKLSCCKVQDMKQNISLMPYGTTSVKDVSVEKISIDVKEDIIYNIRFIPTYNFIICDKDGNNGVVVVL